MFPMCWHFVNVFLFMRDEILYKNLSRGVLLMLERMGEVKQKQTCSTNATRRLRCDDSLVRVSIIFMTRILRMCIVLLVLYLKVFVIHITRKYAEKKVIGK